MPTDLPADSWLDALDGVAYLVGLDGTILQVGRHWDRFAERNDSPQAVAQHVVGRDLFGMIAGDSVRDAYREMHRRIIAEHRDAICFTFRCDAPAMKRTMRMAITGLRADGELRALLYQSLLLSEVERPPLALFAGMAQTDGYAVDEPRSARLPLVVICSYCHDVGWPAGAADDDREWISPEAYYARGGQSQIDLSHGICPSCLKGMFAEDA